MPSSRRFISILFILSYFVPQILAESFDVKSALGYEPSKAVGAIGFIVYTGVSILLLWRLVRNRDWWGLCLPIGGFAEASGFMLRVFINEPRFNTSLGYYIVMYLLIVASPAAFLAFNYIVYGRLMRLCVGPGREHTWIRPKLVGIIFIVSDVVTFLVQVFGGSLSVQQQTVKAGQDIFIAGIAAQAASYLFYLVLVVSSQLSLRRTFSRQRADPRETWYSVFKLLYISSIFIIIRSIYRVIESALGFDGYLSTHEWPFLVFDSIPLAIGISTYICSWPGDLIPKTPLHELKANLAVDMSPYSTTESTRELTTRAHR